MAELDMTDDEPAGYNLVEVGRYWQDKIQKSGEYFKTWTERCKKIEKIYLDQSNDTPSAQPSFPLLWANICVLQPAVYARAPQPAVDRRFKDSDPVARTASEMVERSLDFLMDTADIDSLMRQCRDDFLLVGRGVAWLRYEADIEPIDMGVETSEPAAEQERGMGDNGGPPMEQITDERVSVDYVHWSDFLHSPARRWADVTWVARRVHMTRDELVKRFGDEVVSRISIQDSGKTSGTNDTDRAQNEGKTGVWEIWCKTEDYTVWIAEGAMEALEVSEPPLDLVGFWPCPRPAFGTLSTSSLIPVPDYRYYQDQAADIDRLTQRISKLTDQLRLKIFYPSGDGSVSPAIERAMQPSNDTVMIPIPEWAAFTDKGGSNSVVTLPIDDVQKVILACISARKQIMDDVFQLTGLSDILRGDTEASETATAQRLKSQWGSIRIRDRQAELARFARDIIRIAGEIVCNQFQPDTLMAITGIQLPTMQQKQQMQMQFQQVTNAAQQAAARAQQMGQPTPQAPKPPDGFIQTMQQPTIDEVMQLLRDDNIRGFRIDIETDSTIAPDEDAARQRILEFAKVVGGFIQQAGPIAQQQPMLVPVMGEVLLAVVRNYRAGRQLESSLEEAIGQISVQATAPKPPPQPSPDEQIKLQTTQVKAQAEQQKAQLSVAQAQVEHRQGMEQMRSQATMDALAHQREMEQMAMQNAQRPPQGQMQ